MKLKSKVTTVCDILRASWEEHAAQLVEDDAIIDELEKENIHLRDLLKLNVQGFTFESIEASLRQQEHILEEIEEDQVIG